MTTKREAAIEVVRDLFLLAGAGLISVGTWMVYRPAGFIVAGVLLLAGAIAGRVRA